MKKHKETSRKPKVLLWDAETSHNLLLAFELDNREPIPYANILQERHFFSIAYKWLGEKTVHSISILDDPKRFKKDVHDDTYVLTEFSKVLAEADAQVYHYGRFFDTPMFNARLIAKGLPPVPKIITIDTQLIARTNFRFNTNRLDYLARLLGYKGKLDNPKTLWIDCFMGNVKALKHMIKYNKQDVDILEFIYNRLAPFAQSKLNMALFFKGARCPFCGSTKLNWRGHNLTKKRAFRRCVCLEPGCGQWSDERDMFPDETKKKK